MPSMGLGDMIGSGGLGITKQEEEQGEWQEEVAYCRPLVLECL